ncbi:MAG TPA: hypothetical protein VFY92_03480 [Hyphomicrobiaceae bacterium]|nr:hypothetical protein [Hyphomicrobiaceae bacterium]
MAAANVHIHVAPTAAPPAIGVDLDSSAVIASVAMASPDIDVGLVAAAALGGALPLPGPFLTGLRPLRTAISVLCPGTATLLRRRALFAALGPARA